MADASVIGIDLGGTKVLGAVLADSEIVESEMRKVRGLEHDELVDVIEELVRSLLQKHPEVTAVGLGVPCQVDHERGVAIASVNLPIANFPVRDLFSERLGLPVAVENDGNCAAYAEAKLGAGKGADVVVCLTVGTGIGSGVVIGGTILRGSKGYASEAGHMIIRSGEQAGEGFPKVGSLEWLASGKTLERLSDESGEDVLSGAREGDAKMSR